VRCKERLGGLLSTMNVRRLKPHRLATKCDPRDSTVLPGVLFWLCSGRPRVMTLFEVLGLLAHWMYWSGMVRQIDQRRRAG
jgi:hypothetical protein